MRNKLLVSLLSLLTVIAFSNLANSAPDPEGFTDTLYVVCGTNIYPGSGTATATFEVWMHSDNTGGNKPQAFGLPFIITGANLVSIDTTVASAFTGTAVSGFSILSVTKNTNNDPTVFPAEMVYGAVNFTGGITGNQLLAYINVTVDDTGTICIDSFPTGTTPWDNAFVTELAVGYGPVWPNPPGYCCTVEPYVNQAPTVSCGPDRDAFAGGTFNHLVLATDPDDPNDICDNIVSATFQFLDSTLAPIGPPDTAPCGVATLSAFAPGPAVSPTFNWNTTGCGGGDYYVVFTFTDECGGSGADTCKYTIKTACAFVTIGEVVADPCESVELPVYLNAAGDDIGGFNFCIEFANADLTVISVRRGELINAVDQTGKYIWHYFTYRLNPSTVIHKYKVCVVGIGKVYSSYTGMCIEQGSVGVLFYIKFVLACNELFRCHDTHVYFEWDDWTCLENTLSDCTGQKLYVSDDPTKYDPQECGLGEKNEIVRCVNFGDGRVIWRCAYDVDPIIIGDINVNGFPYEIADAVCFADYFISFPNPPCFSTDPETRLAQEGATDINGDGYILSVADFVYLLRIVVGDQAPLGAAVAPNATATVDFNGHKVVLNTPEALGAIVLTFKGDGKLVPMVEGLEVKQGSANGETRAIVYSMTKGKGIESGNLFAVSGNLMPVKVEAATYNAAPINVEVTGKVLPTSYDLSQNYPNPFNATTQINFALPNAGNVSLKIYNVAGQLVKSFNQPMEAGYRTITWDGTNSNGDNVASGVYFYRLDVEKQFSKTLKMTLLK